MRISSLLMFFFIAMSAPLTAQPLESCVAAQAADDAIASGGKALVRDYPGTLAFYGFSTFMLSEAKPERLEQFGAGIVAAFVGCSILIDTKSCDFVAGRLVTLFASRAAVCIADKKLGCGICK